MSRWGHAVLAVLVLSVSLATATPVSLAGESGATDAAHATEPVFPTAGGGALHDTSRTEIGPVARDATVVTAGNATAYLAVSVDAIETAGYRRAPLDVAGAMALDAAALGDRLDREASRERFDGIDSSVTRRARVRASAERIETRIDALGRRQTAAVRVFNHGVISQRMFLRRIALIDATAEGLDTAISRLMTHASSVPGALIGGEVISAWARDRRLALTLFQGPVRDRLAETIHTDTDPPPIYVETTSQGVVLAGAFGGRYHREAVLPEERTAAARNTTASATSNTTTPGKSPTTTTTAAATTATPSNRTPIGVSAALDRVRDLYPAAWLRNTDSTGSRGAGFSRVTLYHNRGRVRVYFDRETGAVFAEQQRTLLSAVPTTATATNATDTLELRVNRTHPTGPLQIDVIGAITDEPHNASLSVGGTVVGTTGVDGERWTIQPRGAFTVTARSDNESVRVAVNATT